MARRTKRSLEEKLTDSNIERVISLLEAEKPITKKAACEILNIAYNTTRLTKLLEDYKDKKARDAQLRAEKRGKPVTSDEAAYIIQSYLEGAPIDSISKSTHRGVTLIKHVLEKYGCPARARSPDYFHPELIPEPCMRDSFKVGDTVYSARYDSIAKIKGEYKPGIYRIWLSAENQQQHAYQPVEELAALDHLAAIGVRF